MKKASFALSFLFIALLSVACSLEEEQPPSDSTIEDVEQDDEDDAISLAMTFLELLVNEEFETAVTYFNGMMTAEFSASDLEQDWLAQTEDAGEFIEYSYQETIDGDEFVLIVINGVFEHDEFNFTVAIDEAEEIAGFFVQ